MKRFRLIMLAPVVLSITLFAGSSRASAQAFQPNLIMDDSIFDSVNTMSAADIDNWLNNSFGSTSCISTLHKFTAPDPTGYNPTQGFLYGGNVSAGKVIYDAAQAYGINPQVLLATLQKEQSLVDGTAGCSTQRYAAATGYGCPDGGTSYSYSGVNLYSINGTAVTSVSGTCVNSTAKVGFSQQVIHSAWLLRFGEQRSEGNINWAVIKTNWDNSDDPQSCYGGPMTQGTWQRCPSGATTYYDGYTTIDSTSVHMDSGATATLYWYTPHFAGNQNFYNIFSNWFGSTTGPGYSFTGAINPLSQLLPNDTVQVQIQVTNRSGTTWYPDGSVPSGQHPTRLVMAGYKNTPYANNSDSAWLGTQNQVRLSGTTAISDGQVATFTFTLRAPLQQIDGYQMKMTLVEDGVKFYPYIGMSWTVSTPSPNYGYQVVGTSGFTGSMPTSHTQPATLTIKNTGNIVWFGDGSKPAGSAAVRLLTSNPFYHSSVFYDSGTWLTPNQISMSVDRVDPGSTTTFSFNLITPSSSGIYTENFGLVLDGITFFPRNSELSTTIDVTDYLFSTVSVDMPSTLLAGQKYAAKVILKNTGWATWYSDGNTPTNTHPLRLMTAGYRATPLADQSDANWLGTASQIKMTTPSVAPGQTGEFDFSLIAPYNISDFKLILLPVLDGVAIFPYSIQRTVQVPSRTYDYIPVAATNPPSTMSPGQVANVVLTIKNNTNFTWYSDGAKPSQFVGGSVRLVMNKPYYRNSLFANPADANWLGTASQIKMTTPSVAPGQTGEFDFTWKAPNTLGDFKDTFTLVLDGYSFFPYIGMQYNTRVQ